MSKETNLDFPFYGKWELFEFRKIGSGNSESAWEIAENPTLWEFLDVGRAFFNTDSPMYYGKLRQDVGYLNPWNVGFYYFPATGRLDFQSNRYNSMRMEYISDDRYLLYEQDMNTSPEECRRRLVMKRIREK